MPFFYCSPGILHQTFLGFLIPVPSGCFLTSSSSPLPGFALQSPCSSTQSLPVPVCTCRHMSQATAERDVVPTICPACHRPAISLSSNSSRCSSAQLISLLVRGFLWMWEHLCFLQVPSNPRGMGPIPLPLFFFSPFFCPTWSSRIFFVLSSVQGLQLTFSWCSVRTFPSVDVFLMHLWREMKLDVLLLLCHLSSSHLQFFIFYFICITLGG